MKFNSANNVRVLYVCGGRSFFSKDPGRKISGVVDCWRSLGYNVFHVCGGDILGGSPLEDKKQYAPTAYQRQWHRQTRLLAPLVRTVSERRDIKHDTHMLSHLEAVCESFRPDLIWERSCRLHSAGLATARRIRVPYVLEWKDHVVDYWLSLFRGRALTVEAMKNREADYIVVESLTLREKLAQLGVNAHKIIVAHNAVRSDQFTRDDSVRIRVRSELGVGENIVLIGYLGSYAWYHDTKRLVQAAVIIREQGASGKIRILMVGTGKEYAECRSLAQRLGLLDDVLMMKPKVPKHEVPGFLAALDVAVLPGSTNIICPIKVQEYMACELPSVVPDFACNREVIHDGVTGVMFQPNSAQSLADKILYLARQKEVRQQMGRRAREEVIRRYSWESTWGAALKTILDDSAIRK